MSQMFPFFVLLFFFLQGQKEDLVKKSKNKIGNKVKDTNTSNTFSFYKKAEWRIVFLWRTLYLQDKDETFSLILLSFFLLLLGFMKFLVFLFFFFLEKIKKKE